jgi:hypothetical protein
VGLATHIAEKSSPAQGRAEETSGEELAQAICTNMIRTISSEAVGAYVVSTVSSEAVGAYVISTVSSEAVDAYVISTVSSEAVGAYVISTVSSEAVGAYVVSTVSSEAVGAYVVSTVSSEAVSTYVVRTIGSDAGNIGMGRTILCNYCCTNGVMCIDSGKCKGAAGEKRECKAEDQFVSFHGSCSRSIQCLGNSVWSELYSAQKY